jgi:cobalt-precorrin-5B (C1)-methyltransferase
MSDNSLGYTLPVFACAAAIAALRHLDREFVDNEVEVNLINPPQVVTIPIEQVARLRENSALAIARSDPGKHLDITRNTPIWALVELGNKNNEAVETTTTTSSIEIRGGEGIGIQVNNQGKEAIYSYARQLLQTNLQPLLVAESKIRVTIILPEGKRLAERTSNAAFGVLEGLSLLGTTGIVQPLIAPEQLANYQAQLQEKATQFDSLVFCVGENGLDLASRLGIAPGRLVKTANWLGSMLVVAAQAQVKSILLFGYHGKLIKLAGGIFHTHHHLADGRLEILTAHCAQLGLPTFIIQKILNSPTTEAALQLLREFEQQQQTSWVEPVYSAIAEQIDRRAQDYIRIHSEQEVCIGSVLFDRQRRILKKSENAVLLLANLC